jgi:hypothetical protein
MREVRFPVTFMNTNRKVEDESEDHMRSVRIDSEHNHWNLK